MRKFCVKVLLFALLLVVADRTLGHVFRYMQYHSKGGDTKRMMMIADSITDDIIIMGSSRAIHHYDPRILEDSLGLSCYNCGRDGNGILFSYGQYRLFRDRHTPRLLICDVHFPFDIADNRDNDKYLGWLRYFYDRDGIDSLFIAVDPSEKWKMMSLMRRYNEKFIQIASDMVHPLQGDIKGYRPLEGMIDYKLGDEEKEAKKKTFKYDSLKMIYWRRLIRDCKARGTQVVLAVSPIYDSGDEENFSMIRNLAEQENVPFLYHYADSAFVQNRKYFKDRVHLNRQGAERYTRELAAEIRNSFIKL